MSTKTLRKRIALVAVATLGAGVLSVAPANAATGSFVLDASASGAGICAITASDGSNVAVSTDIDSTLAATHTITVVPGTQLEMTSESGFIAYANSGVISAKLGAVNVVATTDTQATLNAAAGFYDLDTSTSDIIVTALKVGTVTITSYATDSFTSGAANAIFATPEGRLSINVVATCGGGWDTAESLANVAAAYDNAPAYTDGDVLTYSAGADAFVNVIGNNSYGQTLPASTVWVATATNNAKVKIGTSTTIDDTGTADGTSSFATYTGAGTSISIRVSTATPTTGGSTVVTLTADGVSAVTRTITWLGEATSIVVVKQTTGLVGGEGLVLYVLKDAAGNTVPGGVSALTTTYTNRVNLFTPIKSATILASDASPNDNETINATDAGTVVTGAAEGTTAYGLAKFACAQAGGTGTTPVTVRHTNDWTEADIDLVLNLSCAGGLNTYTVSMDKAAYKLGEIATVTVTAKDSTGAAVSDHVLLDSTGAPTVSAGGGTLVKATAASDAFSGGVKTYQVQMTTAGAFNAAVNLPGVVTKSATAAYTVSGGDVAMSEVLKAIVSLIASINKQIAALQKALLKK
jgi:hypothetical protein